MPRQDQLVGEITAHQGDDTWLSQRMNWPHWGRNETQTGIGHIKGLYFIG